MESLLYWTLGIVWCGAISITIANYYLKNATRLAINIKKNIIIATIKSFVISGVNLSGAIIKSLIVVTSPIKENIAEAKLMTFLKFIGIILAKGNAIHQPKQNLTN